MRKSPTPPRLLQIALDGAEARSIEAGTGPLGYRDCAVIANGVRPVLADLRAQVEALHAKAEVVGLSERAFAYEVVLKLINGGNDE